jgi:hypothetical protein
VIFPGIAAKKVPGYRGIQRFRGPLDNQEVEFVTSMGFDSWEAVKRFAGEDLELAYVPPKAREVLARVDERSQHYEIKERLDYPQLAYPRKERFSCGDRTRNPMPERDVRGCVGCERASITIEEGSGDMGKDSGGTATGAAAFKLGPPPEVPREVQASFQLWLTAVAAGLVETIIRVIDSLSVGPGSGGGADVTGVAIRVIVYTVVVYIIFQMRLGKRWARLTLAVLLGVIGTLSLVIDPISWFAAGNSLREVFAQADLLFVLVAPIRAVHLTAVIAAMVFMFLPAANNYFRRASSSAGASGSATVV